MHNTARLPWNHGILVGQESSRGEGGVAKSCGPGTDYARSEHRFRRSGNRPPHGSVPLSVVAAWLLVRQFTSTIYCISEAVRELTPGSPSTTLEELTLAYARAGRPLQINFRDLVAWKSYPERATHLFHPYPAKLLAHIPYFFLSDPTLTQPGDLVLDPFAGSGTVLLEALLAGRNAVGADANPLARLVSSAKVARYDIRRLRQTLDELMDALPRRACTGPPAGINVDYWFSPRVTSELLRLREGIAMVDAGTVRQFLDVCFSCCVRKVSLADPRLSVPVRLRAERYPQDHWLWKRTTARLRHLDQVDVVAEFRRIADSNIARAEILERDRDPCSSAEIISSDARKLVREYGRQSDGTRLADGTVQLIITSPPYAGAQKYFRASSLSLGWLGFVESGTLRSREGSSIGREHFPKQEYAEVVETGVLDADVFLKEIREINPLRAHIAAVYLTEIREFIKEATRVLASDGHFVLVIGNNQVCGREFRTADYLASIARSAGLETVLHLVDDIKSRGLMTKRNRTAGVITQESVLLFRKAL